MAFANRSAALVHLADYERALVDIEQALGNGYPHELRYKLAERQVKCLCSLARSADEITQACEGALKSVADSKLDAVKRTQFERDIRLVMQKPTSASHTNINDSTFQENQVTRGSTDTHDFLSFVLWKQTAMITLNCVTLLDS